MPISDTELLQLSDLLRDRDIDHSKSDLLKFTEFTKPNFQSTWFHIKYYTILTLFALGKIKNLIISVPPQHGKSEGSTRRMIAFLAGLRTDARIALVCYAATKSEQFGREIMNIMLEPDYQDIFPDVKYPQSGYTGHRSNTNMMRESIGSEGSMKFVGIGGALTGDPVDILIYDDLYKNWKEASSPLIRQNVWDYFIAVGESRLHNDSQQLIVYTRWSEDDLVGRLEEKGFVKELTHEDDLTEFAENLAHDEWLKINFPALKETAPNDLDPREIGQALWPERHSVEKHISTRKKDVEKFNCMYQGDPQSKEGLLYGPEGWQIYKKLPETINVLSYTDTANGGDNYLCSIVFEIGLEDKKAYIIDVLYTQDAMEVTEPQTAEMFMKNELRFCMVESNNGGEGFARAVAKIIIENDRDHETTFEKTMTIDWFHQGRNKEARIHSESNTVKKEIVFPEDWANRWPLFYKHLTKYKKVFKANEFDDAPDTITGVAELLRSQLN